MTVWLHPAAALVTVALAAYAASLGLASRRTTGRAVAARRRHAALAPWVYGLVIANWAGGLVTVLALRADLALEPAASGHFAVGSVIALLFTTAAWLSRRIPADARARTLHPLLGATAVVLCGVQVFLGLRILR